MTSSMTFIDIRDSVPDELRVPEMHNVPELILGKARADDVLRREVK